MADSYPLKVDIAIVGGGLVGASLCAGLMPLMRRHGFSLALVEASAPKTASENTQPSFDARATALSYGSRLYFERLGLWLDIAQYAEAIKEIHVSDQGRFGSNLFRASDHGVPALGYVIANAGFGGALYNRLASDSELELIAPDQVESVSPCEGGHCLTTAAGRRIEASLLVVADGGRSNLAAKLGVEVTRRSYRQHAVIANLELEFPHENRAFERFTANGPLALLPLPAQRKGQNRMALVLSVDDEQLERVSRLDEQEFLRLLQSEFGYRLGRFLRTGERSSYPLVLQRAREQVRPGLLVLGNAAHNLHPIAGQGFNLALRGVADFIAGADEALGHGESLADFELLRRYQRKRQADQDSTLGFTDQTLRVFTNNDLLLGGLRGLAMMALELPSPVKSAFVRKAMGL